MSKTDKVEITEDMHLAEQCWWERHNKRVDILESIECFSEEYTPKMELGESYDSEYTTFRKTTLVMLELPTELVKQSIEISKEVNEKYKEEYGEEWGITPFDVLAEAYEKTDVMHYSSDVVEEEMEKIHKYHNPTN